MINSLYIADVILKLMLAELTNQNTPLGNELKSALGHCIIVLF